jgi:succinyl-diaminopimelate desuccinylase
VNSLELLKSLVSINSVNPFQYFLRPDVASTNKDSPISINNYVGLGAETEMNLFIEDNLLKAGFEVSRQELHPAVRLELANRFIEAPARWNTLAVRYPKTNWNGKSILLFGHSDTVDVKQGWDSDPFTITPRVVDGYERWYGLGSNDMKGGLAAILAAVNNSLTKEYAIKVALVVDEEFYSFGAEKLCQSEFLNDVVLALAPEIGDTVPGTKITANKSQLIGIGRTGRVEFDVHVTGKACHGTDAFLSKDAVNAVHESAKLQVALINDFTKIRRVYSANNAESINSAFISYHHGGEIMLSVPDRASFVVDRTLLPDESPEDELTRIQKLATKLQSSGDVNPNAVISISARPRPTPPCQPYICPLTSLEIRTMLEAVKLHSDSHSYFIGRSVADENRVAARGIPTLTIGPIGAGSHTAQEWVDPLSVVRVSEIYKTFISSL